MNAPVRKFEAKTAVREAVPLLVGLMGPSGGGKTFSALRLATGIQRVRGGDIHFIDTEARRGLHYADQFKFKHIQFDEPFGSLDYLEAIRSSVKAGAGVIVVDSMSHEHEGPGGLLDFQDQEFQRMGGKDSVKMLAWAKPKAARRRLINSLLQMNAAFVFCFRAKNASKPVKKDGKTEVVQMGFMPIAGEEFVFEMTLNALLLPHAGGAPSWRSDNVGERLMMKLPEQFKPLFADGRPLDEAHGEKLAEWARGGSAYNGPASSSERPPAASERSDAPMQPDTAKAAPGLPERVDRACAALGKCEDQAAIDRAWAQTAALRDDIAGDPVLQRRLSDAHAAAVEAVSEASGETEY